MVITNQGVAIQPCFQQAKHMQSGTKHASKGEIELAVLKALGEVLIEVLSFGFRVAELVLVHLLAVLLVDEFSLVHTVIYDVYKQIHN